MSEELQIQSSIKIADYHSLSHKVRNKLFKMHNGNIKLPYQNKGSSDKLTKIALTKDLIDQEVSDLVSLNESNCTLS